MNKKIIILYDKFTILIVGSKIENKLVIITFKVSVA